MQPKYALNPVAADGSRPTTHKAAMAHAGTVKSVLLGLDGAIYTRTAARPAHTTRHGEVTARALPIEPSSDRLLRRFTRREAEIAGLLVARATNGEIARELGISCHTARHHTERVMEKLRVKSRNAVRAIVLERVLWERGGDE